MSGDQRLMGKKGRGRARQKNQKGGSDRRDKQGPQYCLRRECEPFNWRTKSTYFSKTGLKNKKVKKPQDQEDVPFSRFG